MGFQPAIMEVYPARKGTCTQPKMEGIAIGIKARGRHQQMRMNMGSLWVKI